MSDTQRTSEWLWRTVIAAVFAGLGFVGKDIYVDWKQRQAAEVARLDSIMELSALLDESESIFLSQNDQVQRLLEMLQQNHKNKFPMNLGYDEIFYAMFDHFTTDEMALHKLIRSTTMHSQRRLNQAMSKWLQGAHAFKKSQQLTSQRVELSKQLKLLELHLNQWHDKYEVWMPDPKRSLVYLADEKEHGIRFPQRLKKAVDDVVTSWH
jgi:hypothetical protein